MSGNEPKLLEDMGEYQAPEDVVFIYIGTNKLQLVIEPDDTEVHLRLWRVDKNSEFSDEGPIREWTVPYEEAEDAS